MNNFTVSFGINICKYVPSVLYYNIVFTKVLKKYVCVLFFNQLFDKQLPSKMLYFCQKKKQTVSPMTRKK